MVRLLINLRESRMQHHGSKYFADRPLPTPYPLTMGSKGQNSTFSEHGHVAYQIKDNHECSNMVANILPSDHHTPTPPPPLRMGSSGEKSIFRTWNHEMQQYCSKCFAGRPPPHPVDPRGMGSKGQHSVFTENGNVIIKLIGITKCRHK